MPISLTASKRKERAYKNRAKDMNNGFRRRRGAAAAVEEQTTVSTLKKSERENDALRRR
jgi:hypothetical protein